MPLTIILFKNVLRDSELYASDSTRLAAAAASDAAATNRRRSCPRVSHHSTARSSEQPASPSARIQGGGGATAIRLSRKLRAAGTFARAHARRSARSGNTAQLKQSRVKVFRAARAAPLLRVCRQVRRGQEVAPGAWLLKGERSVRRSSPRLHGGTTARWVSLHEHTASSTPCIYIIPTGHTYCCFANVHTA